jgi:anaerobic glycerol-3-phosphate dehydrogenase
VEELGTTLGNDLAEPTIVLPPLPSRTPYGLLAELGKRSGKRIAEPAVPLSWPGRRFQSLLEDTAGRLGVRVLKDRRVVSLRTEGRAAVGATLYSGPREQEARFGALVLATGGVASGGLAVEGTEIVDPLGLFRVGPAPGKGVASPRLLSALSAGVVTRRGRALTRQGDVLRNVVVAGSLGRGVSYPLGRGLGDVLVHAWKAARTVEEAL